METAEKQEDEEEEEEEGRGVCLTRLTGSSSMRGTMLPRPCRAALTNLLSNKGILGILGEYWKWDEKKLSRRRNVSREICVYTMSGFLFSLARADP